MGLGLGFWKLLHQIADAQREKNIARRDAVVTWLLISQTLPLPPEMTYMIAKEVFNGECQVWGDVYQRREYVNLVRFLNVRIAEHFPILPDVPDRSKETKRQAKKRLEEELFGKKQPQVRPHQQKNKQLKNYNKKQNRRRV